MSKQSQAITHLQTILSQRSLSLEAGVFIVGEEAMRGFEHNEKYLAVDMSSGIWIGQAGSKWQCLSTSCTVSSAAEAVEFLIKD